ncbi:MAG: glycosyltransferase family 39 protein [Candidatus Doudnabacteria bacterium]|nr:glycosyltransferase family 39 protein [Candidatus Doudnabacteria bacterium]
MKFRLDRQAWVFIIILLAAGFLRLANLGEIGLQSDPAHYAMRALGWFDFLAGEGQTSPVVWLNKIPWWGNLSFHDHPPLAFAAMFLSLNIFADTDFFALLPSLLASLGTVIMLFVIFSRLNRPTEGIFASGLFAISSYAVWTARSGYIESLEIFFITACVGAFLLYLDGRQRYFIYAFGLAALALLTKYTAVFLIPAILIFLLFSRRQVFLTKKFWLGVMVFVIVLAPVVVYNFYTFKTTGHFDAALTSLLGLKTQDFSVLEGRGVGWNFLTGLRDVAVVVSRNISFPFLALFSFATLGVLWRLVRRRLEPGLGFVFLVLCWAIVMFVFLGGGADRYLPVLLPALVILTAFEVVQWWRFFSSRPLLRKSFTIVLVLAACFELFYAVNTNVVRRPVGKENLTYSSQRFYVKGFVELDRYLRKNAAGVLGERRRLTEFNKAAVKYPVAGRQVVLIDERLDWFSRTWYFDRYFYYYNQPYIYFRDLLEAIPEGNTDIYSFLRDAGATGVWLVLGKGGNLNLQFESYNSLIRDLEKGIMDLNITPAKDIHDYRDELVVRVYHLTFKQRHAPGL